jgi:hypothetical protein
MQLQNTKSKEGSLSLTQERQKTQNPTQQPRAACEERDVDPTSYNCQGLDQAELEERRKQTEIPPSAIDTYIV